MLINVQGCRLLVANCSLLLFMSNLAAIFTRFCIIRTNKGITETGDLVTGDRQRFFIPCLGKCCKTWQVELSGQSRKKFHCAEQKLVISSQISWQNTPKTLSKENLLGIHMKENHRNCILGLYLNGMRAYGVNDPLYLYVIWYRSEIFFLSWPQMAHLCVFPQFIRSFDVVSLFHSIKFN